MESFVGNIDARLDAKGRVPVPVLFRNELIEKDSSWVLSMDLYQKCLVLYTRSAWEIEKEEMRKRLDLYDEEQAAFYETFVSEANPVNVDTTGRILIPKRFIEEAGMVADIRFVGVDNKIKVWSVAEYNQFVQKARGNFKADARRFLVKPKTE